MGDIYYSVQKNVLHGQLFHAANHLMVGITKGIPSVKAWFHVKIKLF